MLEADAKARLSDLVAATVFPALDDAQLTRLLRAARRADSSNHFASDDTEWAPNTVYSLEDTVVPPLRTGHVYKVTDAGTSGAVEPTWPTVADASVTLDGVTYTEANSLYTVWGGSWDLFRAAAEGWRIKAGNVSNRHAFGSNQGNYNPEQVFEHCMKMADYYASKTIGAIQMASGAWDGTGRLNAAHFEDAI